MSKDRRQLGNGDLAAQNSKADQQYDPTPDAQLEQEYRTASKQAMQIHASQQAGANQTRVTPLGWAGAVAAVPVRGVRGGLRNGNQLESQTLRGVLLLRSQQFRSG